MGVELRQRLLAMPEDTRRYGHLHLMEPHQPYTPPEEYLDGLDALGEIPYDLTTSDGHNEAVYDLIRGRLSPAAANLTVTHMRMRYRASLRYLDDQLQAVWASLEADGLLDDTLVVVWTDHGEQFMEHGYQAHAWTLYDDEAAAALFFWSENLVAGRHDGPTSGIDMAPTVLASLGVHSMAPMEGLPFDQVPADRPRFLTSWGKAGMFQAVVTPTHKLHFGWTDPDNAPVFAPVGHGVTVFDRAADPLELSGTFDASDPTTQALWGLLLPHIGATLPHTKHVPHWPDGLPTY